MTTAKTVRTAIAATAAGLLLTIVGSAPSIGASAGPDDGQDGVEVTADDPMSAGVAVATKAWPLFQAEPEAWGDAYYDGDTLVINTVTRSVDEAAQFLAEHGITKGFELRQVTYSIADYERAMGALRASGKFRGELTSYGPDYSAGVLKVNVTAGSFITAEQVRSAIEEQWQGDPASIPPVVIGQGVFAHLTSAALETSVKVWPLLLVAAVAICGALVIRVRARRRRP